MRYFFEIAYDGNSYNGWQTQPNATGVQQVVEDCLSKITRESITIVGSGRTDAGVHCRQQFFHADVSHPLDERFIHKVNSFLPADIAIASIRQVHERAHARFDAILRQYCYKMVFVKDPFSVGRAWHFFKTLDIPTMNHASALLLGKRDFQCFSKVNTDVNTFVCEVFEARWELDGDKLEFYISANRFLRGMVRAIVGTIVDVGTHKTSVGEFESILRSRDRREAGQNVPPYGLYLMRVSYPDSIFIG
jgi:tRNA pseudouridine38-40 synthase